MGLMLNGLGFSNRQLYLGPQFFANKPVEHLLGEGIETVACGLKRRNERMDTSAYEQLAHFFRDFADIPETKIVKARQNFQPVSVRKGAFLLRAGEVPRTLGFVVSGVIRLFFITPNGDEITRSFRIEKSFLSSYRPLLLGEPSRLFLQALEPRFLLVTPYKAYQELTAGHPCWRIMDRKLSHLMF